MDHMVLHAQGVLPAPSLTKPTSLERLVYTAWWHCLRHCHNRLSMPLVAVVVAGERVPVRGG